MVPLGIALLTSLVISLAGTPVLIRVLRKHQYGQFIRKDGPTAHYTKRGTPTMGGVVIILATVCGWIVAHIASWTFPSPSGWLLMLLIVGLGLIGFLDDY
ncbi:MAG: phospho-N-acetylmuramoyl-pentapeptide-transferase, partial [Varibaculum cambriense]|nr:phospho-N-acetylmuramoyl-pentapeptide-transferase [Varibaculum cambriense]